MRESFLIYKSFYEPIKGFSDEQMGRLFRMIFEYQISQVEPEPTSDIYVAFMFFKNQFRLDNDKYEQHIDKQADNGRKGGAPKGNANAKKTTLPSNNPTVEKTTQNNPNNPTVEKTTQTSLNDNVKVNVKDINNPPLPPLGGIDFDFSFVTEPYRKSFFDWLEYKAAKKQKYNSQKSLESCYHHLLKLARDSPTAASEIVEHSMANNWAGLYVSAESENPRPATKPSLCR